MNANSEQTRPADLVTVKEAAKLTERSKSTIRSWVRKGKITGHKEDMSNPTSPLLLSKSELLLFCSINKAPTANPNMGRPEDVTVSIEALRKEIDELKAKLDKCEVEKASIQAVLDVTQQMLCQAKDITDSKDSTIKALEAAMAILQSTLDISMTQHADRVKSLESQLHIAREYLSMPWWKKWNSSIPLLTG